MTVATFFKLLGLIAAAGLHPIVTLLGLSLAGTGSSRPSSAIRILSSPVTTIVLAGLLALEMVGSRLGRPLHAISKFLTRFGHMPLALGAGGLAAASQLQTHSVQHLALPVALGVVGAGMVQSARSTRRKMLPDIPVISPIISWFEGVAAAAIALVAFMWPVAVPFVIGAVIIIAAGLTYALVRRTARFVNLVIQLLAGHVGPATRSSMVSNTKDDDADWIDGIGRPGPTAPSLDGIRLPELPSTLSLFGTAFTRLVDRVAATGPRDPPRVPVPAVSVNWIDEV